MGYVMKEGVDNNSKGERDFPPIPEDVTLRLKVERWQEKTMPFTDDEGKEIKKLKFYFSIQDEGELKGAWISGDVNLSFVPKSKLTRWASVLLDAELKPGFNLDPDVLVGRKCEGVTIRKFYGENKSKDIVLVDDIFPLSGAATGTSDTPSPAPASQIPISEEPF